MIVNNHSSAGGYGTSGSATVFVNGHDFIATNLTISNDYGERQPGGRALQPQRRPVGLQQRAVPRQPGHLPGQRPPLVRRELLRRGHRRLHLRRRHGRLQRQPDPREAHHRRPDHRGQHRRPAKTYGILFYRCTITGAAEQRHPARPPVGRRPPRCCSASRTSARPSATAQPWTDMSGNSVAERPVPRVPQHRLRRRHQQQPAAAVATRRRPTTRPQRYLAGTDGWNPV